MRVSATMIVPVEPDGVVDDGHDQAAVAVLVGRDADGVAGYAARPHVRHVSRHRGVQAAVS